MQYLVLLVVFVRLTLPHNQMQWMQNEKNKTTTNTNANEKKNQSQHDSIDNNTQRWTILNQYLL